MQIERINELNAMFAQLTAILFIALSFVIQVYPNIDFISKIILFINALLYVGVIPWFVCYYLPAGEKLKIDYIIGIKLLAIYLLIIFTIGIFSILIIFIFVFIIITGLGWFVLIVAFLGRSLLLLMIGVLFYIIFSILFIRKVLSKILNKILQLLFFKSKFRTSFGILKDKQKEIKILVLVQYLIPVYFSGYLLLPVINMNEEYYILNILTEKDLASLIPCITFIISSIILLFIATITPYILIKSFNKNRDQSKEREIIISPKNTQENNGGAKQRGRAAR